MADPIKKPLERESTIVFEDIECRPGPDLPIAQFGKPLAANPLSPTSTEPCTCSQGVQADIALLDKMVRTYTSQAGLFAPRESLLRQLRSNCQLWSDELLRLVDNDGSGTISVKDFGDADSNWILFEPNQVLDFYQEYFFAAPQEFAGADDLVELLRMTSSESRSYSTTSAEQKARQQRLADLQQQTPGTNAKPSLEALAEIAKTEVDAGRAQSELAVKQREFVKFALETALGSSNLKPEDRIKIIAGCIHYGGDLFKGEDRGLILDGLDFLAETSQESAHLESRCLALNALVTLTESRHLGWCAEIAYEALRQGVIVVGEDARNVPDIIRLHYLGSYALRGEDRTANLQTSFDIISSIVRRNAPGKTAFGKATEESRYIYPYGGSSLETELYFGADKFKDFWESPEQLETLSSDLGRDALSPESVEALPDCLVDLYYLLGMDMTAEAFYRSSCADRLREISEKDDDAERSERAMKYRDAILLNILTRDKDAYSAAYSAQELIDRGVENETSVAVLFEKATRLDNLDVVEGYYGDDGKKEYMERLIQGGYASDLDPETGFVEQVGMQGLLERYAEEFPEGDDHLIEFLSSEEMINGNKYSPENLNAVATFLGATYDDAETADLIEEYRQRAEEAQRRRDWDD